MAVWEVAVDQTTVGSTRPVVNIFHVDDTGGFFAQPVANAVKTAWQTRVMPRMTNVHRTERVRVRSLDGILFAEAAIAGVGGLGQTGLISNSAVLVSKIVPGLPRKRYGRMFVCGAAEVEVDQAGFLTAAALTAWQNTMAGFHTDLSAAGVPMCQPYWTTTTQGRSMTSRFAVESLQVQSRLATQRRRLRG